MIGFVGSGRHVLQTLFNDPQTLPHLSDSHHGAIVTVTVRGGRDVEIKLVVARVRPLLAKVPFETRGAQARPGDPPFDGFRGAVAADALGARLKDSVLHDELVILPKPPRQISDEIAYEFFPASGQILGHAADAKPSRMHARAANRL